MRHFQMRDKTTQPPNACSQGTASHRLHSLIAIEIARHMPVVTPYWEQGRTGDRALIHGVRAASAEATARGRVHRIRGIPHERQPVEACVGIHRGCRRKQGLRVGMQRRCGHLVGPAHLHDPPEIHDEDAVAEVFNDQQVMRDEQLGQAQIVLEGL